MTTEAEEIYLSPQEASELIELHLLIKYSCHTLASWRCAKRRKGPPFIQLKSTKYPKSELLKWIAEEKTKKFQLHNSPKEKDNGRQRQTAGRRTTGATKRTAGRAGSNESA